MGMFDKLRQEAKADSRRFGKSTVCRIVSGQLLSFIEQKGLTPNGIFFNNKTGLDSINNKILVIPITKYDEVFDLYKNYNNNVVPDKNTDLEYYEKAVRTSEAFVRAIKQNLILVTVNHTKPEGKLAGPDPETYDILIDGVDVNQAIEGTYVYRNPKRDIREQPKWNKK